MSLRSLAVVAVVLLSWAGPANAQGIKLRFHEGLVTLSTQNAPLRAILNEWAKQGGTTIVNGEKVAGAPMSIELNAVSERQALEVLLRGVSGYMLAPRPTGTPGVSVFDRIMILPTSSAPANAAAPAGRGFPTASAARPPFPPGRRCHNLRSFRARRRNSKKILRRTSPLRKKSKKKNRLW